MPCDLKEAKQDIHIPDEFYRLADSSRPDTTTTPTGNMALQQLIAGKPDYWVRLSSQILQPQELILTDYRAFNWSCDKRDQVIEKLLNLIAKGFSIYIWQAGHVVALTEANLADMLKSQLVRNAIEPEDEQVIADIAVSEQNLAQKNIQFLNDYWIDVLLSPDPNSVQRVIDTSDLCEFSHDNKKFFKALVSLQKSLPRVNRIIVNIESRNTLRLNNWMAGYLTICFPQLPREDRNNATTIRILGEKEGETDIEIFKKNNITALVLSGSFTQKFIEHHTGSLYACSSLREIMFNNFFMEEHSFESLRDCIKKMESVKIAHSNIDLFSFLTTFLKKLTVVHSVVKLTTLRGSHSLSLEDLYIQRAIILVDDLCKLIEAVPRLKTLQLAQLNKLDVRKGDALFNALIRLTELEELQLDFTHLNIDMETMHALLLALPRIKKVKLYFIPKNFSASGILQNIAAHLQHVEFDIDFFRASDDAAESNVVIQNKKLSQIVHLSKLTLNNVDLGSIASQVPGLKELTVTKSLPTWQNLQPNSFLTLKSLSAAKCRNINSLLVLLKAAPTLENLHYVSDYIVSPKIEFPINETNEFPRLKYLFIDKSASEREVTALLVLAKNLKFLHLNKNYFTVKEESTFLDSISLQQLETLCMSEMIVSAEFCCKLIKSAPGLKHIVISDSEITKINNIDAFYAELEKIAPHAKIYFSNNKIEIQFNHKEEKNSHPIPLMDPVHSVDDYLRNRSSPANNPDYQFTYQGQNKTLNQGMVIEKLSQYLTIKKKKLELIPQIQDGICKDLSLLAIEKEKAKPGAWNSCLQLMQAWDGQQAISAELETLFEDILKIHARTIPLEDIFKILTQIIPRLYYLGDQVMTFLATIEEDATQLTHRCIVNPWHSISVWFDREKNNWRLYDPNFADGVRVIQRDALAETLKNSLGTLISVVGGAPSVQLKNRIHHLNNFLQQGGLLALLQEKDKQSLLAEIKQSESYPSFPTQVNVFPDDALQGLFFRDTQNRPVWIRAIHDELIRPLATKLLLAYIAKNPEQAQQKLLSDLANVSEKMRKDTLLFLDNLPSHASETLESKHLGTQSVFQHRLRKANYKKLLATWETEKSQAVDVNKYCQEHLAYDPRVKKQLIELSGSDALQGMRFALEEQAKKSGRPVIYIHSAKELACLGKFIQKNADGTGTLRPGPGGRFFNFILENMASDPIILLNFANFSAEDIAQFESIVGTQPSVDNIALPPRTTLIGLTNSKDPNCYRGEDFTSQFDRVEACSLPVMLLRAAIPTLPFMNSEERKENCSGKHFVVHTFHSGFWQEILRGQWTLDKKHIIYQLGILPTSFDDIDVIEIHNGLWHDAEFMRFWQEAYFRGDIPARVILKKVEGYDWEALKKYVVIDHSTKPLPYQTPILNSEKLNHFFQHTIHNRRSNELEYDVGFIRHAAKKGMKRLSVYVTHEMKPDQWAQLLLECQAHQVTLFPRFAPGVSFELLHFKQKNRVPIVWRRELQAHTHVIQSDQRDVTVAELNRNGEYIVIDASECNADELLMGLHGELQEDKRGEQTFAFSEKTGILLDCSRKATPIILVGTFGPEVSARLSAYLLQREQWAPFPFVIVSEDTSHLRYVKHTYIHTVSTQEKAAHLDEKIPYPADKLATHSLSQLRAYQQCHLAGVADPWQGMEHLQIAEQKNQSATLLDTKTSHEEAISFMEQRVKAVNAMLDHRPFVYLAGLTGVGKTTFIKKNYKKLGVALYENDDDPATLQRFIDDKTPGRKMLFLDEEGLTGKLRSELESLMQEKSGILLKDEKGTRFCELSAEHKIIFASNPQSYGGERKLAHFFKQHGGSVIFEPLSPAVIYEDILKPIMAGTVLNKQMEAISELFLAVYAYLVSVSTTRILISPRELEEMALETKSRVERDSHADPLQVARHYAFEIAKDLPPPNLREAFKKRFEPPLLPVKKSFALSKNYLLTVSRQPIHAQLGDVLALREERVSNKRLNEEQKYGGLGGIILEGGSGNRTLVLETLRTSGYQQIKQDDHTIPNKPFVMIPASMPLKEKTALLMKAFHLGAVIVMKNMSSASLMERLMNALLMRYTLAMKRPDCPGATVIAIQDSPKKAGRRAASTALSRRLVRREVPDYTDEEVGEILKFHRVCEGEIPLLVDSFKEQSEYANANHLSPAPTMRDLLRIAPQEKLIDANEVKLEEKKPSRPNLRDEKNTPAVVLSLHHVDTDIKPAEKMRLPMEISLVPKIPRLDRRADEEIVFNLTKYQRTLRKEVNSCWPYFFKDRKRIKIRFIDAILTNNNSPEMTLKLSLASAEAEFKKNTKTYRQITAGFFSTRMQTLITQIDAESSLAKKVKKK